MVIVMREGNEIKKLIQMIIIVIGILLVFYGITVLITKYQINEELNDVDATETIIEYDKILVSDIYKQKESVYYVLATLEDDTNLKTYNSKLNTYNSYENITKVYSLNLNSAFNKKYVKGTSDFTLEYPVFKESTLLKIENNKLSSVYEGSKEILTQLEVMINSAESQE